MKHHIIFCYNFVPNHVFNLVKFIYYLCSSSGSSSSGGGGGGSGTGGSSISSIVAVQWY